MVKPVAPLGVVLRAVTEAVATVQCLVGIHVHNDADLAVANTPSSTHSLEIRRFNRYTPLPVTGASRRKRRSFRFLPTLSGRGVLDQYLHAVSGSAGISTSL